METKSGGIPMFANAGFAMYHPRLTLPVDDYIPVMGFGLAYATMTQDDSQMPAGSIGGRDGNEDEYTYRSSLGQDPDTLHQWEYTDATSSDVITLFLDSLYYYDFNENMDGYVLIPSMAADFPQPVNAEMIEGRELGTKWQITVQEGLEWTYHAGTDTSGFAEGHEEITAADFVNTYKLAIEQGWFRAISGGGHFWSASQEIVNARAYYDEEEGIEWEDVGIKLIDEYTFEFEFVDLMDEWSVRYWLGSFVMTPINFELYESLADPAQYGTTPETTAYNGRFKIDVWEPGVIIRYSENEGFHDPDRTFYTHYLFRIIPDAEIRFLEFIDGQLDAVGVPGGQYDAYAEDERMRRIPGATTFRLMYNGLGTVERQQEQFPGSTYVPEPIMAYQDFRDAMFHVIERDHLAEVVLRTSQTQMYYFTDAYLVDAQEGIPFRMHRFADMVSEGFSPESHGYDSEFAQLLFEFAARDAIADGHYRKIDVILLSLYVFSGSEAQINFGMYVKDQFEENFVLIDAEEEINIRVSVQVIPREFPAIYFDYMMTGDFDLAIGGISGSALNAASFLDVFCSDNRGGFTLVWGIDTSQPEIEITWGVWDDVAEEWAEIIIEDPDNPGQPLKESWSFDAVVSALNGTVDVSGGREAE